jgi:hypothetical protein
VVARMAGSCHRPHVVPQLAWKLQAHSASPARQRKRSKEETPHSAPKSIWDRRSGAMETDQVRSGKNTYNHAKGALSTCDIPADSHYDPTALGHSKCSVGHSILVSALVCSRLLKRNRYRHRRYPLKKDYQRVCQMQLILV